MTHALMMLALTLPPSLAFVIERWMRGREAQARKLSAEQVARIDALAAAEALHDEWHETARTRLTSHDAELKRLDEQISILSERTRTL